MVCSERRSAATAPCAMAGAALPKANTQKRWSCGASRSASAAAASEAGATAATDASYSVESSARPCGGDGSVTSTTAPSVRPSRRSGERLLHRGGELVIGRLRELVERQEAPGDTPRWVDHEEVAVVHRSANGAVELAHLLAWVTGEQDRRLQLARPRGEGGVGVNAHGEHDHTTSVIEEPGVLITVRLHLDRSALGPRPVEEGEHDGLAAKIGEVDRLAEDAIARGAREGEVGCHRADFRRSWRRHRGGGLLRMCGAADGDGEERGNGDAACCLE